MTRSPRPARLLRRSAAVAVIVAVGVTGTATAAVTGTVATSAGVPLPGVTVQATGADGFFADSAQTDVNGAYTLDTSFGTAPFTLEATLFDPCRESSSGLTATSGPLPDGAVQGLVLDPLLFCGAPFTPSGQPEATGHPWPERAQVLSGAGGVTYLRALAPFDATGLSLTLADGTPVGGGTDRSLLTLTAPAASYSGPLDLTYTSDGVTVTRRIGTLLSGKVDRPTPPAGPSDLAAIVDISGSMSAADPTFRRRAAVQLLVDLSAPGDRLVGTGFDDAFTEIFPRTAIAGQASRKALIRLARKRIVNDGGTDYNVGIGRAYDALAADPLNPAAPKAAIFVTDGANNGTYDNAHLRFAFNGTGRSWPVCVVRLGRRGFRPEDTVRLRRIARETGGLYTSAATNAELESIYFRYQSQCHGRTPGTRTLVKKTASYQVGQTRAFVSPIAPGQRTAAFFVSWGAGRYRLEAVQPGGRILSRKSGRVRVVRGRTSSLVEVRFPKPGLWRVQVTRLGAGLRTDKATTTVTSSKRR